MRTVEMLAAGILGVIMVVVVLQRGDSATRILNSLGSFTTGTVKALVGAPR